MTASYALPRFEGPRLRPTFRSGKRATIEDLSQSDDTQWDDFSKWRVTTPVEAVERDLEYAELAIRRMTESSIPRSQAAKKVFIQGEATPLDRFIASPGLISEFITEHNGTGLFKLSMRLANGLLSESAGRTLVSDVIEDALIATFHHARGGSSSARSSIAVDANSELILLTAIGARLPRLTHSKRVSLARKLLQELTVVLGRGQTLLVDGGIVEHVDGRLQITCTDQPTAAPSVKRWEHFDTLEVVE